MEPQLKSAATKIILLLVLRLAMIAAILLAVFANTASATGWLISDCQKMTSPDVSGAEFNEYATKCARSLSSEMINDVENNNQNLLLATKESFLFMLTLSPSVATHKKFNFKQ